MSLRNFRYLRTRRIAALIVILTLTSTLFSITACSFLGFYNSFSSYIGEGNNDVAVYNKASRTPFTGNVPIGISNVLSSLPGIISTSTETLTPCLINGHSLFVRGIVPQELSKINQLTFLQGEDLNLTDAGSAIVGVNLAHELNVKIGDRILVLGVQSERYAEAQIKGIFRSATSLDDEVLVPVYVGQWLRGLNYDQVTLIRAKIDPDRISSNQIYQEIANQTFSKPIATTSSAQSSQAQTQQQVQALLPLAQQNVNIQNIGVEGSLQLMANYLDHYGVTKDTLLILSVVVLLFSSGTASIAIALFIKQHNTETNVLRAIGITSKKLKTDLVLKMLLWCLVATIIGTVASAGVLMVFQRIAYLQVLSQTISFQVDPVIIVANFVLLSCIGVANIVRAELKP